MLKEVSGDILLSCADAIVHGIAPLDHFNQGLALAIRERWPALYKDFRHYCLNFGPKCGDIWTWGGASHTRIISLFTQEAPKSEHHKPGKSSITNVHHCLKALKKEINKEGFKTIAIPKIACGVGGLEWSEVKAKIWHDLDDCNAEIHVYSQYIPSKAVKIA